MKKIIICFGLLLTISSFAYAADFRGLWEVEASGHKGIWIIGNVGQEIYGAAKWSTSPGFSVDRISGEITGDSVAITRHIIGQGSPESGTQVWYGTIQGDRISGTWSGLGGNGKWSATIKR
jgi:hypothetical protein